MKLWDAYSSVNGDTSKLEDLLCDNKVDTCVENPVIFVESLNRARRNKLLEAYIGYCMYESYIPNNTGYINKLYKEMMEYLSTFTNKQLERLYNQYEHTVVSILVTRVVKNPDVLDSIRNRKLKSDLILGAIFEDNIDLDLLKQKRKGIIPPPRILVPMFKCGGVHNNVIHCLDWILEESDDQIEHLIKLRDSVNLSFLLNNCSKFSAKTILIAFSVNYPDDNKMEKLVSLVFNRLSMQEFLETIYDTSEKYEGVRTDRLQELYFQFREHADI